jgi:hypothetical protein
MTLIAGAFVLVALVGFLFQLRGVGGSLGNLLSLGGLTAAVIVLISMSRTYITALQDRIIGLEMRVRCAALLSPEQQRALQALDPKRIAALRFASDEEIPSLVDRTVRDSLLPDQIKRAIRTWVPDLRRT